MFLMTLDGKCVLQGITKAILNPFFIKDIKLQNTLIFSS